MPPRNDKHLDQPGRDLAAKLLHETREELVRADTKGQILFAAIGVVISVVIGGILSGDWRPSHLSCRAELIWWIGAGAAAVGVGALAYALWPRIGSAAAGRVRYFADIRPHERTDTLIPDLNKQAKRQDRDAEQLLTVAPIVWKKYIAIRVAIIALSASVILTVVAVILG